MTLNCSLQSASPIITAPHPPSLRTRKKGCFISITMDKLIELVEFSLTMDNFVVAAGQLWSARGAYPWVAPFAARWLIYIQFGAVKNWSTIPGEV